MALLIAGQPARKKLDALQAQIAENKRAQRNTERAPLALEDVRARVHGFIAGSADDWGRRGLFVPLNDSYDLPTTNGGGVPWGALIALLGADTIEERIVALHAAEQAERGLPLPKRKAKLSELRGKLRRLERDEELEVLALEDAGHEVLRRSDVDAGLLVEIWQAKSAPTPGSLKPDGAPDGPGYVGGSHVNDGAPLHAPAPEL